MSFPTYPLYKRSGLEWFGGVPTHWTATSLKRVVEPLRPITYGIVQAGPDTPGGIPYIRPVDMTAEAGLADPGSLLCTSESIAAAYKRSEVRCGDLVCSIGPSFGKVMVVPKPLDGANLTQGTARVAIAAEHDRRFVFWVLRSLESFAQWECSIGGATFRALNLEPLAETRVIAPPLSEQQAIADFLDRETAKIDGLIAEQERLIALLREKRQAVSSRAVTKGLDPNAPMKDSGVEWLGEVPAHWEVIPLKRIVSLKSGDAITSEEIEEAGPYAVYGGNGLRGYCSAFNQEGNFVLIGRQGALCGNVNYASGKFWASEHAVVATPRKTLATGWLGALLETMNLNQYSISAAQPGLSVDVIGRLRVPVPPWGEQEAIQARLTDAALRVDTLNKAAMSAIILLRERRAALISVAVTGKIDVRDLASAPAEAA